MSQPKKIIVHHDRLHGKPYITTMIDGPDNTFTLYVGSSADSAHKAAVVAQKAVEAITAETIKIEQVGN